ncbi:MAG: tRNA 2-thiocytidine biosynthesis protein TtcA [Clostridia bacterium]|nr:tRNA 2-thiocytidine biosynthesis protein TtcA [Clostridia bacterium]
MRRADFEFDLIHDGDRIAVGLSGGKDSLTLLHALHLYGMFSHKNYSLCAITVDPGLGFDPEPLRAYCQSLNIPYVFAPGAVVETALSLRKDDGKTPCFLCAKMRRGALNRVAAENGCNVVALGHHRDDALETFLMSMFYEGRLNTLAPRSYLERTGLTVIRPMLYLPELHIKGVAKRLELPVCPAVCPYDGHTMRETMKQTIKELSRRFPNADEMMFAALRNTNGYHLWDKYRVNDPVATGHLRRIKPEK